MMRLNMWTDCIGYWRLDGLFVFLMDGDLGDDGMLLGLDYDYVGLGLVEIEMGMGYWRISFVVFLSFSVGED